MEIINPWLFIDSVHPPKDGSFFIVWDEILEREVNPIHWCSNINDFASGETEWSGSFVFWRKDDGATHASPYYYQH